MNIKEQIRKEIDTRRQNMVYELYGVPENSDKYIRVKGMHDAYVDMLAYIDLHLPERPVDGLEETADLLAIAHLQGMEQQKAKMMEDAVEGVVENWNPEPHPEITIPLNPEVFGVGDKVRVIVIKEDEK